MYKFLSKNGSTIAFLIGLAIVVTFASIVYSGIAEFQTVSEENYSQVDLFNFGLYAAIVLIGICVAIWLIFGIIQMFTNFSGSIKTIIGLAVILIIFFISYSTAVPHSNEAIDLLMQENDISDNMSRIISGGIWTTIIMIGIASLLFVISEIVNVFK